MTEPKRWTAEEPTTPQTRSSIARLTAAALERLEKMAPGDEAAAALYLSAPFPCAIDRAVQPLVDGVRVLDAETRAQLGTSGLTATQARVLALFAERMAYLAVRKRDPGLIVDGLVAAAVLDRSEGADTLVRLCGKLYQSAIELAVDPVDPFERAARLAAPAAAEVLAGFARRDPGGRIL